MTNDPLPAGRDPEKERDRALVALGEMVNQYCGWKTSDGRECYFHMFMGAGEGAFEVLEDAGLLESIGHENYVFTDAYKALCRKVGAW